ncbi:recombinase family protein [Calderihabitans maritimus]|uniref:Recombinase n=1 Tax=Calderihabitans maritimus TaxID=1246530 RepID=A0A1Z5HNZ9_9FIRM|nr:recombinase family protein [Calderihabitans maritimus]GAW91259.1 hypothetical protein KKC1_04210 [Calderihabitans maritimus]
MEIKRIICYLRRSRQDIEKEKRTGEDTLANQKKIMLEALDKLQIIYDIAEEIGSGDKIETRPVFQQVLKDIETGKYDAVAVKEIPRLGRGTYSDMGKIYDLIISKRIYIVTPYKIYDPANPADARQIRFELFLAREEFEMIKERLVGAKYNLAAEGRWVVGAAPFGYQLNSRTGRLEINEEEAQIVRLIFTLYVYGLENGDNTKKDVSFRAIATYLTRMGVPTPRKAASWNYLTVKRIIENPVYAGTLKYRTKKRVGNKYYDRPKSEWIVVENAHEPIISQETWELAQAKLKNTRATPNVKLDFSPCELAGLVVCAKCGRHMVRQYSIQHYRRKDGEVSMYRKEFLWCRTPGCTFVKYRDVEAGILKYLAALGKFDVKKLKEFFEEEYTRQKEETAPVDTDIFIEKKKTELKRRLDFICEKYEAGIYDDEMFIRRKDEIEKELNMLEKIIKKQNEHEPADTCEQDMLVMKQNIKTFLEAYKKAGDKTLKNKLLRELVSRVIVNKTGRATFDLVIYPRFTFNL